MDTYMTAEKILYYAGGKSNIESSMVCMTRLRLHVCDPNLVDRDSLNAIPYVLGVNLQGQDIIDVVFGPGVIDDLYRDFVMVCQSEDPTHTFDPADCKDTARHNTLMQISPSRLRSYKAQAEARRLSSQSQATRERILQPQDDIQDLCDLLEAVDGLGEAGDKAGLQHFIHPEPQESEPVEDQDKEMEDEREAQLVPEGPRLLVINGPNINMLGLREPSIYGDYSYAQLVKLCLDTAEDSGFVDCRCFQSNHEGDLVDEIQAAWKAYDAIVINPAAYTHTSIAILDALKVVRIPTIEVHLSDIDAREDFRHRSYITECALETIKGLSIQGYALAIEHIAYYLKNGHLPS